MVSVRFLRSYKFAPQGQGRGTKERRKKKKRGLGKKNYPVDGRRGKKRKRKKKKKFATSLLKDAISSDHWCEGGKKRGKRGKKKAGNDPRERVNLPFSLTPLGGRRETGGEEKKGERGKKLLSTHVRSSR